MRTNILQARKALLALFAMLLSLVASAHDFEVDGIYYNITSEEAKTAEVTYKGNYYDSYTNEYSGSITIPATVTHNGVAYSVTSIGESAFESCSSLMSITIPEGVTSIGERAFYYCRSLETVINYSDLPLQRGSNDYGNVAYFAIRVINIDEVIDGYAFKTIEGVHYLTGYIGDKTELTLPADYKGGNYQIGESAFESCSRLTTITLPEGVTSIGDYAFYDCSSLTTITIPEGVTSIGNNAFSGCSLTTITLPASVTSIGNEAFRYCSLTTITIPEGVTSIGSSAFYGCSRLTTITLPEGVTSIGDYAFRDCSSLTAINIPKGVTSIGERAFYDCSSLKTVINYSDLPLQRGSNDYGNVAYYADRVINIDEVIDGYAFKTIEGVHYLTGYIGDKTELTLPANYKGENYQIGDRAFYGCSSLTAITIPESVTSIGERAFYYCSSLKTVINYSDLPLQRGSNDYGNVAYYANRVINVDEVIDGYAFKTIEGVHYLTGYIGDKTELTLPADYKGENYQIGECAFYKCSSLTAITIPESVTSIGESAFEGCESLKTVINYSGLPLQRGINDYGYVAYYADRVIYVDEVIDGYAFKTIEGVHYLTGYIGDKTELTLPADYKGENYQIGNGAFEGCSSLTAITLPEGVTSIGDYAFYYCSSLTAITLPESVTSIGGKAFRDCSSLTSITLPEGVTSIGWSAFDGCSSLTSITLPEGVTSIELGAFSGCSSLTTITIPENVTSIGDYAFRDCSSLTAITIPEGVTSIGYNAFEGCSSLKTVINYSDLPIERGSRDYGNVAYYADRVINFDEVIDGYAFKTTEGVHYLTGYIGNNTELTLPADYKGENYQIGERAFYNCSSLTAITIPENVTSIGEWAFYDCSSLTAITISENSQLTSIGWSAFYYCSSLTAINIPEGVTSIGGDTFYYCSSLKELTLGKGLKKIAAGAFNSCTALEKVTIYATRPPSIDGTGNAFFSDATYENATLYVPQGCIDKYQVMAGWSSFDTIEEMEGGTPNYLTLRQADNGEVGIVVDLGRTYKVRITAFEGWKIHSVTFNGEEVTAQLTEEGTFTTPALQADAVLNIAYEKIDNSTMVANASASRIKVQGHHGTLRITGTTEGEAISVYTTDGMLVAQESAEESETELTLPTGQVYIVTVADKVVKIGL